MDEGELVLKSDFQVINKELFNGGDNKGISISKGKNANRTLLEELSAEERISRSLEDSKGYWLTQDVSILETNGNSLLSLDHPNGNQNFNQQDIALQLDNLKLQLLSEAKRRKILEDKLVQKEYTIRKLTEEKSRRNSFGSTSPSPPFHTKQTLPAFPEEDNLISSSPISDRRDELPLLQAKLEEKEKRCQELEGECKKASLISWRTMNDKLKQDVEMEVWRRKFKVLQEEQAERDKILAQKDEEIQLLKNELNSKSEANYKMALKLLDYQTKVSNVELQLRRYSVKRIYKFYPNVDVEIILTKNPGNGTFSVDIVEKGRHFQRSLKTIQMVSGVEHRFTITYGDFSVDTFENENASDIVDSMNEVTATSKPLP